MSRGRAMLCVCISSFLWASGGMLVKLINAYPLTISGMRAIFALPVLLLIYPPSTLRFTKRAWLIASSFAATGLLYILANKLTTAANAIVLQYISPIFIILFGRMIFKKRVVKADVLVSTACILGMAMFFLDGLSPGNMLGNILAICGSITNAIMFMAMSRTDEHRGSILVASQLGTALIALPFILLYPPVFTLQSTAVFILFGGFQCALPNAIYAAGSQHCSALEANLISMIEPLVNPLLVMLLFGEKPGSFAMFGGGIILISVLLWNIKKAKTVRDSI